MFQNFYSFSLFHFVYTCSKWVFNWATVWFRFLTSAGFWESALIGWKFLIEGDTSFDLTVNGAALIRGWRLFETWRVLEGMHYVNKNASNNQYLCHVALVAWNCYWSVALNALILNTFYLSYQHSTTISLKSKSQNISIIFYPRNSKVYKYKTIMKKK